MSRSYRVSREVRVLGPLRIPPGKQEWFRDAACHRIGHELFFGPPSDSDRTETPQEKEEREARARALCEGCPARAQCHDYANSFANGLQVGVWHGGNDDERLIERRKEQRKAADKRRKEKAS